MPHLAISSERRSPSAPPPMMLPLELPTRDEDVDSGDDAPPTPKAPDEWPDDDDDEDEEVDHEEGDLEVSLEIQEVSPPRPPPPVVAEAVPLPPPTSPTSRDPPPPMGSGLPVLLPPAALERCVNSTASADLGQTAQMGQEPTVRPELLTNSSCGLGLGGSLKGIGILGRATEVPEAADISLLAGGSSSQDFILGPGLGATSPTSVSDKAGPSPVSIADLPAEAPLFGVPAAADATTSPTASVEVEAANDPLAQALRAMTLQHQLFLDSARSSLISTLWQDRTRLQNELRSQYRGGRGRSRTASDGNSGMLLSNLSSTSLGSASGGAVLLPGNTGAASSATAEGAAVAAPTTTNNSNTNSNNANSNTTTGSPGSKWLSPSPRPRTQQRSSRGDGSPTGTSGLGGISRTRNLDVDARQDNPSSRSAEEPQRTSSGSWILPAAVSHREIWALPSVPDSDETEHNPPLKKNSGGLTVPLPYGSPLPSKGSSRVTSTLEEEFEESILSMMGTENLALPGLATDMFPEGDYVSSDSEMDSTSARKRLPKDFSATSKWGAGKEKNLLLTIVLDSRVEAAGLAMIVGNSIIVAIQTDLDARYGPGSNKWLFISFEIFFCLFFTLDVALRIVADSNFYFRGPGRVLNIWDVLLLVIQFFELSYSMIMAGTPEDSVNLSYLRILRVARAVRIFRSIKVLNHLDGVRICIMAVLSSIKPFLASITIFVMILVCWAIYYTELAVGKLATFEANGNQEGIELIARFYGTLFITSGTLFQCITGGVDWYEPLSVFEAPADRILFYFFIAFSTICMMNVITGIVVQQVANALDEDKMACLLPAAQQALEKVIADSAISTNMDLLKIRESSFKQDVVDCLERPSIEVMVAGLKGDAEWANGLYHPAGVWCRRTMFKQVGVGDGASACIYRDWNRNWCIGKDTAHRWAWRPSLLDTPPQGTWKSVQMSFGACLVTTSVNRIRKELSKSLAALGIRENDVRDIFRICEANGTERVEVDDFIDVVQQSGLPSRRLEQMVANVDVDHINITVQKMEMARKKRSNTMGGRSSFSSRTSLG